MLTFLAELCTFVLASDTITLSVTDFADVDTLLAVSETVKLSLGVAGSGWFRTSSFIAFIFAVRHSITSQVPSDTLTVCTSVLSWLTCVGRNLQRQKILSKLGRLEQMAEQNSL